MDLSTSFLDFDLSSPLTNASGPFASSSVDLLSLNTSGVGIITTKTITVNKRSGNAFPRIYVGNNFTVNSEGLPNPGLNNFSIILNEVKNRLTKPLIVSIGPFSVDEIQTIVDKLSPYADAFELNLSCPNINRGILAAANKPIAEWLDVFRDAVSEKKTIVKLPPYLDTGALEEMADIVINAGIDAIATINSLGNALVLKNGKPALSTKWGGLAGKCIKPIGLGNVHRFYTYFREVGANVKIIGIGGVNSAEDVLEYLMAGADIVGICSSFMLNRHSIFDKILSELPEALEKHGYNSIEDAVGALYS